MSQGTCPTVSIKVKPSEGNASGIVVINESDFDETTMTKHVEAEATVEAKTETQIKTEVEVQKTDPSAKVVAPWKS